MRRNSTTLFKAIAIYCLFITTTLKLEAQSTDNPGDYMSAISSAEMVMNKTYLAYMSAVAHNGSAKKVENMRQKTLQSITDCKFKISDLPYYKGDNSLRKSSMNYIDVCYKVFNDDYAHLVNMEDIAEQSFDEMQMYILLQEKIDEKVKEAADTLEKAQNDFASKYNVTLIKTENQVSTNMEITSEVNHYHNQVYLLFFKCNWQDDQITQAINEKKITGLEESRNALLSFAKEGLLALDSLSNFKGDHSLAQTCRQVLQYYQKYAENDLPKVEDFFLKEENFQKLKKEMDAKDQSSLTKDDVNNYNKAVKDYNASINAYNQLNTNINNQRNQMVNNWNNASSQFLDTHVPHME